MINYFKEEIYRFINSKYPILTTILIILYAIMGNTIYYLNDLEINSLYKNFTSEYIILLMILSFFITSYLYADDIKRKIMYQYNLFKMMIVKSITFILFMFIIFILSIIFSYIVSIIIFNNVRIDLQNIIIFIKTLPEIIFYNLLFVFILSLFKKSSYAYLFSYLFYMVSGYLKSFILIGKMDYLKYLPIYNLNFNNLFISFPLAFFIDFLLIIGLYFLIYFILKRG